MIHDNFFWKLDSIIQYKKRDLEIEYSSKKLYGDVISRTYGQFYEEDSSHDTFQIHFMSPTSFKQRGKYLFYPDLRCIYQSLMNKYDSAVTEESMVNEDTLEQLCEYSQIVRYDLKSVNFSLEGIKIPAFIGKVTIKIHGTQTMANFAHMLFEFGTYSGVGIKTALGMGYIRLIDEGRKQ